MGALEQSRRRRAAKLDKQGIPTGRTGEALNEGLLPREDARHRQRGLIAYEWWYFDAVFDDGHSAVVILWPMNYAKPWSRQCTVQLSIYGPDGESTKHYIFPSRRQLSTSFDCCDVRIGDCTVGGAHPRYRVCVEVDGDGVDLEFEALTPGWKPGTAINYLPFPRYKEMAWLVPVPLARVSGTIKLAGRELAVTGHGYHDHNWGEAPIFRMVDNWHWGHLVDGELGIIWADITMSRSLAYDHTRMFLLSLGGRLVAERADISVRYADWCKRDEFMHPYPRLVTVSFGQPGDPARGRFSMRVLEVVETQELLEMSGFPTWLRHAFYRLFSKPYYFRWRSAVEGWVELDGERRHLSCETIHEQMLFDSRNPVDAARS